MTAFILRQHYQTPTRPTAKTHQEGRKKGPVHPFGSRPDWRTPAFIPNALHRSFPSSLPIYNTKNLPKTLGPLKPTSTPTSPWLRYPSKSHATDPAPQTLSSNTEEQSRNLWRKTGSIHLHPIGHLYRLLYQGF